LKYYRTTKIPLYAQSGIPEVWLVDLVNHCVEVLRDVSPDGYQTTRQVSAGEILTSSEVPMISINVSELYL
jgi:Uma2 family endonuclease